MLPRGLNIIFFCFLHLHPLTSSSSSSSTSYFHHKIQTNLEKIQKIKLKTNPKSWDLHHHLSILKFLYSLTWTITINSNYFPFHSIFFHLLSNKNIMISNHFILFFNLPQIFQFFLRYMSRMSSLRYMSHLSSFWP